MNKNSVQSPARVMEVPAPGANGLVLLTYTRGGLARSYYGESGTRYRFGGLKGVYGYVAQEDVAGLLKLKENGRYLFTVDAQKAPEQVVVATLDTGEILTINKDEVVAYQQDNQEAVFAKIEDAPAVAPVKTPRKKKTA